MAALSVEGSARRRSYRSSFRVMLREEGPAASCHRRPVSVEGVAAEC